MNQIFPPTRFLHCLLLFEISTNGPLHGYALASSIEQKFGWKPSQTAIYNALKSLESEKAVTFEEKIENGRVQKIFSVTHEGRLLNDEITIKIQNQLMKNVSLFLSFMQFFNETKDSQDSEILQTFVENTLTDLKDLPRLIFPLLKIAPKEVHQIITKTISSLKQIAIKNKIQYQEMEDPFNF